MEALSLIQDEQDFLLAKADKKAIKKELGKLVGHMKRDGVDGYSVAHVMAEVLALQPLYRAWNRLDFYARNEGVEIALPCWMKEA